MESLIFCFLSIFFLCSFTEEIQFTEEELELINKVTFITTTSPIRDNPNTDMIEEAQASWMQVPALRKCKKIIVFDGVPAHQRYRALAYEIFIQNCAKLAEEDLNFENTKLVINRTHKHLANSLRAAIEQVDTPYVLVHQHDLSLTKPFDFFNIVRSMDRNPNLKMIRFNKFTNGPGKWDGPVDDYINGGALIPLLRTFGWSDNDHFARTDYYTDFVLPKVTYNGPMEWFLHDQEKIIQNHETYGCYLYGKLGDSPYIDHINGKFYHLRKKKRS